MERNCNRCTGNYCAKKVSIFSILEETELKEVVDKVISREYKKGQSIFTEGDLSDKLYIINTGSIKVFKYTKEFKEQIIYILSEGDIIGDLSLLKESSFEFNAEALENVNICTLAKRDFDAIIMQKPYIVLKLLENIHDRLVSLEKLVQTLSTKDVEARVAAMLISFIKDFGCECKGVLELNLPLSREEMANYIGITRETVSRKLTAFQEQGFIELANNKKIIIKDVAALQELCQ